jgi:hypothetical protein
MPTATFANKPTSVASQTFTPVSSTSTSQPPSTLNIEGFTVGFEEISLKWASLEI